LVSAVFAAFVAVLAFAARAHAAETIYWDNYNGTPDSISFANVDGSGGGSVNLAGTELKNPEGMAYDTATNTLFVASSATGQILFVKLDGSGAGALSTAGVPGGAPLGPVIDSNSRIIYWINAEGPKESIAWAKLDGTGAGLLDTAGATLAGTSRLAIDPVAGRLYWGNSPSGPGAASSISFANVNNTGGGNLSIAGATPPESITGLAVDSAAGRLYWLDSSLQIVSFASLSGGSGGDVNTAGAVFNSPWGLALDPSLGKLYWGNENNGEERAGAIGFGLVAGGGGGISPVTAPVANPQDPIILKSPAAAGVPTVTRNAKARSELTCSQGGWGADFPGSFVYQAPRTFAYQWTLDGTPVTGATATTLSAAKAGGYACAVTAANQTGSAVQTSAVTPIKAAKLKLTTKKKAPVQLGGVVTFTVKAVNRGDLKSKNARVCVKVPKRAKKVLKAPKCKALGKMSGHAKDSAKLRIKVGKDAGGTYKVTFQVRGSAGKSAKAKIVVLAPKKK
jgi:hypothetical protein